MLDPGEEVVHREFFYYVGVRIVPGRAHESPVLYEMVEEFVRGVGRGVMKLLIVDRGFLDGEAIGRCHNEHHVEVLIPLKKNMDLYADALGLAQSPQARWEEVPAPALPETPARSDRRLTRA